MPTIKDIPEPYRFFFFSSDCREPAHVHVVRDRAACKFWLDPRSLASNFGLRLRDLATIKRITFERRAMMLELGMSPAEDTTGDARVRTVEVTADLITAHLVDGRTISVSLSWSWRLSGATPAQRNNYELIGDGIGIHWPDVDEDISVRGML